MEKPARHLLAGANFGEGPECFNIKIDRERLLLSANRREGVRLRFDRFPFFAFDPTLF
jgi:hypothetical protein